MRIALVISLLLYGGSARASYCGDGLAITELGNGNDTAIVQAAKIRQACRVGDSVAIPADAICVIGQVCDFSKQLFKASDGHVMCVVAPETPVVHHH